MEQIRAIKEQHDRKDRPRPFSFIDQASANQSESALRNMLSSSSGMTYGGNSWAMVMGSPPNPLFEHLTTDTKIIVTASSPSTLKAQLRGSHQGYPLVLHTLNRTSTGEGMADLCGSIMDGLFPDGDDGKTAQGNFLIIDPDDMLAQLAQRGDDHSAWLGRLLWLVDSNAGPELPEYEPTASPLGSISSKFEAALSQAFGKRVNHENQNPTIHELDITQSQIHWIKFLNTQEDRLPGITGKARNLLATLVFGVLELTSKGRLTDNPKKNLVGIEVFAQLLIKRMANARSAILYSAKAARNDQLKGDIIRKLTDGPHTIRKLTRRFSSLKTEPCHEMLLDLEEEGMVFNSEGMWHLRDTETLPATNLTLEV
jgi:hypothetical protein